MTKSGDANVIGGNQNDNELRWRIAERHYFLQNNSHVTCAAFHTASSLVVVGFSNGIFALYDLPDFNMLHSLR